MLTIEMLKQNAALTGLTDAQLTAIAEMSKNDENTVIGTKIGALHGQYDADIVNTTGVGKKEGEKSYDYLKRVLGDFVTASKTHKETEKELKESKAKITELQTQIENGEGSEALAKQLKDSKARADQLQAKLQASETELATKKTEYETSLKNTHVDYAFKAATAGLKFKAGITEPIQQTLLTAAKAEILAKGTPDFIDDGKGGKTLVIRGADGNILNNPKNNLNPYTVQELVMESALKDVIDTGRQQTGGGTNTPAGGNIVQGGTLDLSAAKTQVEADKMIETHLLTSGLTRDSAEFAEQSLKLRTENEVANLPIK